MKSPKRFRSLPVDDDVYMLLYKDANVQSTTRSNVMNAILRKHYGLELIPTEINKFNPIVNLRSKAAKQSRLDLDAAEDFAHDFLKIAKKVMNERDEK